MAPESALAGGAALAVVAESEAEREEGSGAGDWQPRGKRRARPKTKLPKEGRRRNIPEW